VQRWLDRHAAATDAIGREVFDVRIDEVRPDEWGELTNRFNDMAAKLKRGQEVRETFGEFQSPEIRDQILERFRGLEVVDQEITVLFADIRGFTKRCAGEPPERVGKLLNRFLSLAFNAIEAKGGYINKVLGDGVMALFGLVRVEGHAALAVACAQEMLSGLERLNAELSAAGQAPLAVGIGIHTGPVVVGCFGATLRLQDGGKRTRREFTAIGETVNYSQRLEQMTKQLGGPVLLSEKTRLQLREGEIDGVALENLGPRPLPGSNEVMVVYRLAGRLQ
jgi:adenylate cyclase